MATQTPTYRSAADQPREDARLNFGKTANAILAPLASLKLTVVLFALSIAIVLFGTLAQVSMDIWEVIDVYFRVDFSRVLTSDFPWIHLEQFFVSIPVQIFFPPAFTGSGSPWDLPEWMRFPFPKGWLIGMVMAVNLIAAHTIRFKTQAKGSRLWIGLGVLAIGMLVTWGVIISGSGKDVQTDYQVSWNILWRGMQVALVGLIGTLGVGIFKADPDKKWHRALMSLGIVLSVPLLVWMFWNGSQVPIDDSGMRILWQLVKGTFAGVVLLVGCILVFKKRAGIVLLHGGIGLMMFYEVLVGVAADEAQMHIVEGETVNFARDIRKLELAVTKPLNDEEDQVTVVPGSVLKEYFPGNKHEEQFISDEELPFDIRIDEYIQNARLTRASGEDQKKVTGGFGKEFAPEPVAAATGASSSEQVDQPSAYVTITEKGNPDKILSKNLLSVQPASMDQGETVTVGDEEYQVFLRFKRLYKPYSVYLENAEQINYEGTRTPRDYSSQIVLQDKETDNTLEAKIWMNNPLRYSGETFYQSGMFDDPNGPDSTTLSVVTNTGWMIPYVSCMIVAVGMLAQFLLTLGRFLNRKEREQTPVEAAMGSELDEESSSSAPQPTERSWKSNVGIWFPLAITLLMAFYLGSHLRTPEPEEGEINLYAFGQIPVREQGRLKPLDSVARNTLRALSKKVEFKDLNDEKQPAIQFLIDLMTPVKGTDPDSDEKFMIGTRADGYEIFYIENLEAQQFLDLENRKGFLYSFDEISAPPENEEEAQQYPSKVDKLQAHLEKVSAIQKGEKEGKISLMDLKLQEVAEKIQIYSQIREGFLPKDLFRLPTEEEFMRNREEAIARIQQIQQLRAAYPEYLSRLQAPLLIPTMDLDVEEVDPDEPKYEDDWEYYPVSVVETEIAEFVNQPVNPLTKQFTKIREAYAEKDVKDFNRAVAGYLAFLDNAPPPGMDKERIAYEAYFNHTSLYYYAAVISVFAFILGLLSWIGWSVPLRNAAFWITVFLLVVHTYGLASRIYISGRPPVTNLYSSAIFIGWGAIALGLLLEWLYPIGIAVVISSAMSFGTLLIAQFLAIGEDTIGVLQAVLDTQFWLATHVVCITFGYATTFVAGFLGLAYFVRGFLTPTLEKSASRDLIRMIYGILCFSIFFSFVGTVLGGLWADDSWGRFWGWDPKENGALIIVLWNALVLHARWGGMVKDRGLACLAMGGNIATSWSWFGVNQLGVGLHSYGFTEGVLFALGVFCLVQLAIIAVAAAVPQNQWWSFKRHAMDG
ncbi:MAG: cytochrome c biogenesis protein CcsA [Planctomycetaceae bacterium]|nr:cytochrome c biogenesis protein CcsA [Planctomycetaceae bacterium]